MRRAWLTWTMTTTRSALLAALALTSCVDAQEVTGSPYTREEIVRASYAFEAEWDVRFGERISAHVEGVDIHFSPKTFAEWEGKCRRGSTPPNNRGFIRLRYVSDRDWPIYETSLWHELTHVVLQRTVGDGDGNHEEPGGPWMQEHTDMIDEMKERLRHAAPVGDEVSVSGPDTDQGDA
jgi:hypothetical protein